MIYLRSSWKSNSPEPRKNSLPARSPPPNRKQKPSQRGKAKKGGAPPEIKGVR